jgi:hypothetical protein
MRMIEVFKTNVENASDANSIVQMLLQHFPGSRINFDLQDCDKILRVEGNNFCTETIIAFMNENGFHCSTLE